MKVYIVADMEGISGVDDSSVWESGHRTYQEGRKFMIGDVNAAVAGAFDAGASEVVVHDWHGGGNNLLMEELDRRARHTRGIPGFWWGELDASFDAFGFVGQHAMAGTRNGFLDHTMTSAWFELRFNGQAVGEIAVWAVTAGMMGVPMTFFAGDRAACEEARTVTPGVAAAEVKAGRGRNRAACVHPAVARERIAEAARDGLRRRGEILPVKIPLPITVELTFATTDKCDAVASRLDIERVGARTVRWTASRPEEVLRV